jgi:hypothetical protein
MSDEQDPPRLRDAFLDAGRSELPDEARLAAIAAKLGPIVGGAAGGGGAAAVATAKTGAVAKIVAGVVLASVIVVTAVVGVQKLSSPVAGPPVAIVTATATAIPITPPSIEPLASAVVVVKPAPRGSVVARDVQGEDDPTAEVKLLERAQDALRSRPADALALCTEHERRFPHGMLAQEREVIAIEALVKEGRMPDATARADRFAATHPSSTHQRRIDALLGR